MTRAYFEEEVWSWSELLDFCERNNHELGERLYSWESVCEWIDDTVIDLARELSWQDLLSRLQDFDAIAGYDYYLADDWHGGFRAASDDDFEDCRREVMRWADENGVWEDAEEDGDDEETGTAEPEDEGAPEEECSFAEMFAAGVGCVRSVSAAALERAREEDRAYAEIRSTPLVF